MPKQKKGDKALPKQDKTERTISERGRYYDALQRGHSVRIHEDDGATTVEYYQLEEGAVLLDPDVREYFPDAQSVNTALRSLIALIPLATNRRKRKIAKDAAQ